MTRPLALLLALALPGCPAFFPDGQVDVDGDGFVPADGDCDDRESAIHPDAEELCDGIDNDCDGGVDSEDDAIGDEDGDGVFACEDCDDTRADVSPEIEEACDGVDTDCDGQVPEDEADADEDGARICDGDCDDDDPDRSPALPEVCGGVDADCDGLLPDEDPDIPDLDEDGVRACLDCDDGDPDRTPGVPELCDGVDNDCVDGVPALEVDLDTDGFLACEDCDDDDGARFPDAPEVCNGLDDACRGSVPLEEQDPDTDGWAACEGDCRPLDGAVHPGAVEACNNTDDDCDGLIDEPDPTGVGSFVAVARVDGAFDLREVVAGGLQAPFSAGGPVSAETLPVAAADIDGDGVVDLLRGRFDPTDDTVDAVDRVSLQCSGLWASDPLPSVSLPDDRRIEATGDLDGDGDQDLVAIRHDAGGLGEVWVQLNDGFGVFAAPLAAGQLVNPSSWRVPSALVDLDGDQIPDLLACDEADRALCRIYPGAGDGTFGAPAAGYSVASGVESVAVGDVDGDQLADLVFVQTTDFDPGAVSVGLGDGVGGFAPSFEVLDVEPSVEAGQGPGAGRGWLRLADVASGPALDVVVLWDSGVLSSNRSLAVGANDGAGGFTLGGASPLTTAAGDPAGPDHLGVAAP